MMATAIVRTERAPRIARYPAWLPALIGRHADLVRLAQKAAWPKLDLTVRLWLAHAYFVSGLIKLMNWQTALHLAAHEYPVSWMDPVAAAYTGVTIEIAGPALLAIGLLVRPAALAMLALALVTQFSYQPFDSQLLWVAFCGWYVVMGAGPLSLDSALEGLADSAVPLAAAVLRATAWVQRVVGPIYELLLRLWVAAARAAPTLFASLGASQAATDAAHLWLPWQSAPHVSRHLVVIAAILIAAGAATS